MQSSALTDQKNRLLSLDALRGLAILLMVLSGSIAFGNIMPAWMYHAQVPPPDHVFNPNLPGITWVDLVFPFFLFSMGAAFPLALSKKLKEQGYWQTLLQIVKRYILLIFFAIFTYHSRAWVMNPVAGTIENILSIGCFALLFIMFSKTSYESYKTSTIRQVIGFGVAISFLIFYPFKNGGFDLNNSDIIIVVLANMALFGSVTWIFTQHKPWLRVAVLPIIMAVFLSGKVVDSWTHTVFNWTPVDWAYTFYYLKYLFIIIPGTFAGDWLLKATNEKTIIKLSSTTLLISLLCILMVGLNTYLLFTRELFANFITTIFLSILIIFLGMKCSLPKVYRNFSELGIFLLVLGLIFEPYEGGIKKDSSTYSYYFVCAGMAFLIILSFILLEAGGCAKNAFKFIAKVGQNPMIAYTAGNLFLLPFLRVFNIELTFNLLNVNAWGGFARGLIFTSIVAIIAYFFTKKQIFWKT